jgi:myo-inositol 2-dehydrogenase/D-chiro-inositol 1-dehydrogenase
MSRYQLGDIVEVQAMGSDNGLDAFQQAKDHAQAIIVMRAASGALCTIVNSRSCAYGYDQRLEAYGDLGSLEAGNFTATSVRAATATHTEAAGPILNFFLERYMPAFKAEFEEFVTALKEDREPSVGFADGRAALVLAEAANESVATGRAVKVG